jgi:hypothetical protein
MKDLIAAKAGIAGTGAVVSHRLEVGQELHHQRRIELFQVKLGRGHIEPIACELQEQLKAVGTTLAGVRARATLQGKPFPKERGEMRGNRRDGIAPCIKYSQMLAMSVTASRLIHAFAAKPSMDTLGSRRCLRVPCEAPLPSSEVAGVSQLQLSIFGASSILLFKAAGTVIYASKIAPCLV